MPSLGYLAPLFLVFEAWQFFMSERYLGIKHIARGGDPREMGPSESVSAFWAICLLLYGSWALLLLLSPETRLGGLCLVGITTIGMAVRRNCGLKHILVFLTFEGAVRIGFLLYLTGLSWLHR